MMQELLKLQQAKQEYSNLARNPNRDQYSSKSFGDLKEVLLQNEIPSHEQMVFDKECT